MFGSVGADCSPIDVLTESSGSMAAAGGPDSRRDNALADISASCGGLDCKSADALIDIVGSTETPADVSTSAEGDSKSTSSAANALRSSAASAKADEKASFLSA